MDASPHCDGMKEYMWNDNAKHGPRGADSCYTAHLLSNGRFTTLLSARGGGFAALDGFALTRWVPDPTRDADGMLIYVRDLDSGEYWTPGSSAVQASAGHTARFRDGVAEFRSTAHDVECTIEVCVAREHDAELRRVTLHNMSDRMRTLEVTTYAELALNTPAADAAHPAFSKLFIQTSHDVNRDALLAWRRARSPSDRPLWVAHRLLDEATGAAGGFETDRALFLGRGRDRRRPSALTCSGPLSGTVGNVLDPVFSLRRPVTLEPGTSAVLVAILTAADSPLLALRTLDMLPHVAATASAFMQAVPSQHDALAALGLPTRWRQLLRIEADAMSAIPGHTDMPRPHGSAGRRAAPVPVEPEDLQLFNGWGGFSADGSEYVIRMPLEHGIPRRPPLPWVNVIANEHAGCIVSESGSVHTWAANSRENRITPWFNDPVTDPHGEALYIRDDESGAVWSPTPGPIPGAGHYEVRHGFGCTRFLHESAGIEHETQLFVPVAAPVRIARIRLTNRSTVRRRMTVYGYAQLVLGAHEADTRGRVETWLSEPTGALMARNDHRGEFSGRVAFASVVSDEPGATAWTTDRRVLIGDRGCMDAPAGVLRGRLDGWAGTGHDPCFALSRSFTLQPGAAATCAFVLGEAAASGEAAATVVAFATMSDIDAARDAARDAWRARVSTIRIETPAPAIDVMVNGWLAYQNLSCRMWARTAYYQSGGAFGFRDQLQDSSALLYMDPALTRAQILLHAAHQFVEGDVLHWWHPPLSKGIRTRFSDDLLWLPYITAFYISRTGDRAILDENVRYLSAAPLDADEDEEFVIPEDAGTASSLYEHCCRALDRSLTSGEHGLPLMGVGDWNDGMNRVGREGRGESVWLGFFLFDILGAFMPLCAARADSNRIAAYGAYQIRLAASLNDAGWDGEWYRRAFYDNGTPLGSAQNDECRIDALVQAWAVLSGAAPEDRAAQALDAMEDQLVDEHAGLIRLLTPPFDRTPDDPGYIKGYLPGVRENGGQYTHGVLWAVRALAEHGRTERAAGLLEMLSPATRGGTPENAARYKAEPYVIAADVYGVAPHIGRGGWTWYTGSAGWMYRVALESVLGLDVREGMEIALRPCMPSSWPGFRITFGRPDGTVYDIEVTRGQESGITLDDAPGRFVGGALVVPLLCDGGRHAVRAVLGADYRVDYAPWLVNDSTTHG